MTTREQILQALKDNQWTVREEGDVLIGSWRRRHVALEFDATGRLTKAATTAPLPFNEGKRTSPVAYPIKHNVLRFIRGEGS